MVSTQPVSASDVPQGANIFRSESGYASGMWGLNRWCLNSDLKINVWKFFLA